eukprot:NODE_4569_length_1147_cov_58.821289_g4051_i0.p1 GENE.NODE_4569_length_1147_cov_58.821289_g4051_i0~~NODE_4569_length_1147_cov_58.821289_g4051_i0.p1  ORF type:complete len:334 (-),score=41.83 NODE_4569_length_1147_cov_58.821289_g4051_i0:83-1084(-)
MSDISIQRKELIKPNFAKFRLRLKSSIPSDVHRDFLGFYYPDTRSVSISESRQILKNTKLLTIFPEGTYLNESGDTYILEDFVVGATLELGRLEGPRDEKAIKTFVITEVDTTNVNRRTPVEEITKRLSFKSQKRNPDWLSDLRSILQQKLSDVLTVKRLGKVFHVMDNTGVRKASPDEVQRALQQEQLDLTQEEMDKIMNRFDRDKDGLLSYEEFMYLCRGDMSEARRQCVLKAFRKMDYNKRGVLTAPDIIMFYNTTYDSRVQSGEVTPEELTKQFMNGFDIDKNGIVTLDEFEDYFNGVSAVIDDDEIFTGLMQRAWNLDHRNLTSLPFH